MPLLCPHCRWGHRKLLFICSCPHWLIDWGNNQLLWVTHSLYTHQKKKKTGRNRCVVPATVCFCNWPQIASQQGSDLAVWLLCTFPARSQPPETLVGLDLFSPTCLFSSSWVRRLKGFEHVLMDFPWATQAVTDQRRIKVPLSWVSLPEGTQWWKMTVEFQVEKLRSDDCQGLRGSGQSPRFESASSGEQAWKVYPRTTSRNAG